MVHAVFHNFATARSPATAAGIGGTEAHVLAALSDGMPAEKFGRVHHLPAAQLAAVVDGMRCRGLVDESGWLTCSR